MTESTTWGILGWFDRLFGRLSDGNKPGCNPSYGATVMFLFALPLIFLICATGTAQIILAVTYIPRISKSQTQIYEICLKEMRTNTSLRCQQPKVSRPTASKVMDFGKWPWIGAMFLCLVGVFFSLIRRTQDFSRFKEAAQVLSVFATNGKAVPNEITSVFNALSSKISGTNIPQNPGPTMNPPKDH